jgi:hypothetical protein
MAIKTEAKLVDDLDGTTGPDVKTRRFNYQFEMELSDANHIEMVKRIGDLISGARLVKNTAGKRLTKLDDTQRERNRKIKKWAEAQGEKWPARGRPTRDLERRYSEATGDV